MVKHRIPLPLPGDARLLLGLSGGDAGILFSGLTTALMILVPHAWSRWPLSAGTLGLSGVALMRWDEEPLWAWLLHAVYFLASPRHFRFDLPIHDQEVSHHASTHETALSVARHRRWHVLDGP
jgi:hypothetical protein